MNPEFWHERWREGQIGFHRTEVSPYLIAHQAALPAPEGTRIFVPLCGKSLDLAWLAKRGHKVLGLELSPLAILEFFYEQQLTASLHHEGAFERYRTNEIEVLCGDFFALDAERLGPVDGYFDRAALIALPEPLRTRYVQRLSELLPSGTRGLLITLESTPHEPSGPPFSIDEASVRALYEPHFTVEALQRQDVLPAEPHFATRGITALHECAYALVRK